MSTKKELIASIMQKLPSKGGELDLSKLPKEQLVILDKKLDILLAQMLEGGSEIVSDMLARKCKSVAADQFDMDEDDQNLLGQIVKNRMDKGIVANFVKSRAKKRLGLHDVDDTV